MNSQPILCIDGGGTRSRGRLVDAAGQTLAQADDGPCNPSTDTGRATASTLALWRRCASEAGRDPADTGAVALAIGAAGLYVPSARERFLAALPAFARTVTMSDGYAALIGAGSGKPCGLIIMGTGIAGHRLWPDGSSVQRDAWGWIGGDRGSGAWIGRKALRHMLAALDGVRPRDGLSERVLAAFGGRPKLSEAMAGIGPDRLGALAPLVLAAAEEGVASAVHIRDKALDHLAALARVLDIGPNDMLYAAGGLATVFTVPLARKLGHAVTTPAADAMRGCYLVAMGRAPVERVVDESAIPVAS